MQNKASSEALQSTIEWLEEEQAIKKLLLQERFHDTFEGMKPINLLRNTIKDITAKSSSMDVIIGPVLGLAAGHLAKKLVVGKSEDPTRQVIGAALQVGVAKLVVQNASAITRVGRIAFRFVFAKRRPKTSAE